MNTYIKDLLFVILSWLQAVSYPEIFPAPVRNIYISRYRLWHVFWVVGICTVCGCLKEATNELVVGRVLDVLRMTVSRDGGETK